MSNSVALFLGTSALDDANQDSENFLGFSWRNKLRKALNVQPVRFGMKTLRKNRFANMAMNKTGINGLYNRHSFEGLDDEEGFDDFETFSLRRKAGGTKMGNFMRKWVAPAVSGAIGGIPGVGGMVAGMLPIGQGLMLKPKEVKEAPAPAIMVAQTPAQAENVVNTLAPNLTGASKESAIAAVRNSNNPEQAKATVNELADADQKAKSRKTMYQIGGAVTGLAVIILIIWLVIRKK